MSETLQGGQYLTFIVKDEIFALSVMEIKEIIEYSEITRVPMMQKFVKGVTNVRGSVIPIIDLSLRFGMDANIPSAKTSIVIVETIIDGDTTEVGLIIDAVNQVHQITEIDNRQSPDFGAKIRKDFIEKIIMIDGKFVIVLKLDTLLSLEELGRIENKKDLGVFNA
ncbi:chemotaxis protein CheW [Arcobacter sp.]|uniref:chemotaxis protein CheW n=1 Tax=Arcobacter sp. TaxID=1872629 RepID=UPI003D104FE7